MGNDFKRIQQQTERWLNLRQAEEEMARIPGPWTCKCGRWNELTDYYRPGCGTKRP